MKQTNITHNIRVDKNRSNRAVYEAWGGLSVILIRSMCQYKISVWLW